jgi:putative Mg2+ transporter-C (MgtC) family protein
MDEIEALVHLLLAAVAGGIIGLEREAAHKSAGVRTFSLVSLGACAFTIVGLMAFGGGDPGSRVAAGVITGIGFLGAGAIIQQGANVVGLTTAAGIWGAAAVGMAFGTGLLILASGATAIMLAVLRVVGVLWAEAAVPRHDPDRDQAGPDLP